MHLISNHQAGAREFRDTGTPELVGITSLQ